MTIRKKLSMGIGVLLMKTASGSSACPTMGPGLMRIGLSIVEKIVELNAGSVRVESGPGKGSTFSFTLPIQITARNTECRAADAVC